MKPIKLLIISSPGVKTPPDGYGAVEQISYNIAVGMHKKGHHVTIVVSSDSDESKYPEGIRVIKTVPSLIRPIPEDKAFHVYVDKLQDEFDSFDIVHDNSHMHYSYILRKQGIIKRSIHNITDDVPSVLEKPMVEYPCMITSSYILTRRISEACQEIFPRTAWYGVDTSYYHPVETTSSGRFLFVGRIQWVKGIHLLIDVCKNNRIPLDVAGFDRTPGTESFVDAVKKSCDGELIRYLGDVSQDEKRRLMTAATALIVPSMFFETFGMVVSEAMACGTPVIVSSMGALKEQVVIGRTGYVFNQFDEIPCLVEQILQREKNDWISDCIGNVKARFTVEKQNNRYEEFYSDIIEGREW
jgi:glycosyltransferase involved in cell wall biosynthesis